MDESPAALRTPGYRGRPRDHRKRTAKDAHELCRHVRMPSHPSCVRARLGCRVGGVYRTMTLTAREPSTAPTTPWGTTPAGVEGERHDHIWALLDGTKSHAPPGGLTINAEGQLACHLCGLWYAHLGSHLRSHGWTAARYRDAVGLARHVALCGENLSHDIADRQHGRWTTDPTLREHLQAGQSMAQSGELSRRASASRRERKADMLAPEHPVTDLSRQLAEGRQAMRRRRDARLLDVIAAAGAVDLHGLLRDAYAAGGSLDSLSRLTGLGRQRVRDELDAAGVAVRTPGSNVPENKRRRSQSIDAAVAHLVGTDDLRQWLVDQVAIGRTARSLAEQTGRSVVWVRARLRGTTTSAPVQSADVPADSQPAPSVSWR